VYNSTCSIVHVHGYWTEINIISRFQYDSTCIDLETVECMYNAIPSANIESSCISGTFAHIFAALPSNAVWIICLKRRSVQSTGRVNIAYRRMVPFSRPRRLCIMVYGLPYSKLGTPQHGREGWGGVLLVYPKSVIYRRISNKYSEGYISVHRTVLL